MVLKNKSYWRHTAHGYVPFTSDLTYKTTSPGFL